MGCYDQRLFGALYGALRIWVILAYGGNYRVPRFADVHTHARKALIHYVNEEVKPTCANNDIYPSRLNWCHCLYPVGLNNTDATALCQLVRTFFTSYVRWNTRGFESQPWAWLPTSSVGLYFVYAINAVVWRKLGSCSARLASLAAPQFHSLHAILAHYTQTNTDIVFFFCAWGLV